MSAFISNDRAFSPYHDDAPFADWVEDDAQRLTSVVASAFALHVGLFFFLTGYFVVPDLQPDEPEIVPVQIVTFEAPQPEPEIVPEPAPEVLRPAIPVPSIAPQPRPAPPEPEPEPDPEPDPLPVPPLPEPEPQPEPEPEPEPEPDPVPEPIEPEPEPEPVETVEPELIPPDVLSQPIVEPEPEVETVPSPEPVQEEPERLPEDPEIIEPAPEVVPEPVEPEPLPESEPEPEPEPLPEAVEPDPEPEPRAEPPVLDPVVELEPEPELPPVEEPTEEPPLDPELEPGPLTTEDTGLEEPIPGIVTDEPEPVVEDEPLQFSPPVEIEIFEPEPLSEPEPQTLPQTDITQSPEIITNAPTILASPEAPETDQEADRAVPTEQADTFFDLLARERPLESLDPPTGGGTTTGPQSPLAGPTTGGGNIGSITNPQGGGTQRTAPGAGGWRLDPGSYGNSPGAGYEGINLDMRCREANKTHLECPEYLRQFQGRDATGFESFETYRPRGVERSSPARPQLGNAVGPNIAGGGDPWSVGIGSNSINAGGPSGTILEDGPEVSFDREFIGNPVRVQDDPGRVRDLITEPPATRDENRWNLSTIEPEEDRATSQGLSRDDLLKPNDIP